MDNIWRDKQPVVLDWGRSYIKCGFAYECSPRCIVRSPQLTNVYEEDEIIKEIYPTVMDLFFSKLGVKGKERSCVLLDSFSSPLPILNALKLILIKYLFVAAVHILPSSPALLLTSSSSSGITVDIGTQEIRILPIYEGVILESAAIILSIGALNIRNKLKDELKKDNLILSMDEIDELIVQCCVVGEKDLNLDTLNDCTKREYNKIPLKGMHRASCCEVLFGDNEEQANIAHSICQVIEKCPLDIRNSVIQNICCGGGISSLPGFHHRLQQELTFALSTFKSGKLKSLSPLCSLSHNSEINSLIVNWVGGIFLISIF